MLSSCFMFNYLNTTFIIFSFNNKMNKIIAYCHHLFFLILMIYYINIISDRIYRSFKHDRPAVSLSTEVFVKSIIHTIKRVMLFVYCLVYFLVYFCLISGHCFRVKKVCVHQKNLRWLKNLAN